VHLTRVPGQRHRKVRREAGRRADADDPAKGRGNAHRAAEVSSLRDRQHAARNGGRGTARGSGGTQVRVPRVSRCSEHRIDGVGTGCEFGRVGLGEHDRAGDLQPPDDLGIFGGNVVGIKRTPVGRPDVCGRHDILDANRQPMQRPQFVAACRRLLRHARVCPRAVGCQCHDCIQRRVEAIDDREMRIENLDRTDFAFAHERNKLMGCFSPEILHAKSYSPTSTMAMTGPPPCGPWCMASTETKTAGSPIAAAATPPTAPFEWRW